MGCAFHKPTIVAKVQADGEATGTATSVGCRRSQSEQAFVVVTWPGDVHSILSTMPKLISDWRILDSLQRIAGIFRRHFRLAGSCSLQANRSSLVDTIALMLTASTNPRTKHPQRSRCQLGRRVEWCCVRGGLRRPRGCVCIHKRYCKWRAVGPIAKRKRCLDALGCHANPD